MSSSQSFNCLYIPRVSVSVTEEMIREEFYNIAAVTRVDFTPLGKKTGFCENLDGLVVKSAFVHFTRFFEHAIIDEIFINGSFPFYPSCGEGKYWLLLRAENPIQNTMMNNAQIVENCRLLEQKVEEQAATIKAMEEKLEGVHNVVYQLVGGLFNQSTQTAVICQQLSCLIPDYEFAEQIKDGDNIWPTTRQGDANENRIETLEKELQEVIAVVNDHANKGTKLAHKFYEQNAFVPDEDDEAQDVELQFRKHRIAENSYSSDTDSTHSSMPGLIDCDSVSSVDSNSSMPELESVSSNGSSRRLRNSYELCGNQ